MSASHIEIERGRTLEIAQGETREIGGQPLSYRQRQTALARIATAERQALRSGEKAKRNADQRAALERKARAQRVDALVARYREIHGGPRK